MLLSGGIYPIFNIRIISGLHFIDEFVLLYLAYIGFRIYFIKAK